MIENAYHTFLREFDEDGTQPAAEGSVESEESGCNLRSTFRLREQRQGIVQTISLPATAGPDSHRPRPSRGRGRYVEKRRLRTIHRKLGHPRNYHGNEE